MIRNSPQVKHSGFTLVELMTTLTVTLVLITAGIPSATALMANNQMAATTSELITHFYYARSESVTRGIPVTICASDDGEVCSDSTEWGTGWIVFTDDSGLVGGLDSSDQLLRTYQPTGPVLAIKSDREFVRYLADGSISN